MDEYVDWDDELSASQETWRNIEIAKLRLECIRHCSILKDGGIYVTTEAADEMFKWIMKDFPWTRT